MTAGTARTTNPLGTLVLEARSLFSDATVVGTDYTWPSPLSIDGGDVPHPSTAHPNRGTPPMIVLSYSGQADLAPRSGYVTVQVQAKCYAKTRDKASELAGILRALWHERGPRTIAGVGISYTAEVVGRQPDLDPGTGWPSEVSVYRAIVAAHAVA